MDKLHLSNFTYPDLPVVSILSKIETSLGDQKMAVLSAPPGAGKTTLVPLYLLDAPWRDGGKIILLEPRRLAARAAATRMASLLNEEIGETVGYRMRLDSCISARTQIEVVTEGVFARMVLDDPELSGISTVIFDEFHERSLDADLGLALALDVHRGLRADLRILVMSATLDIDRIGDLMGNAPLIKSEGRSFPITLRYHDRKSSERIEDLVSQTIVSCLRDESGSILAFLPGQSEIRRTAERLSGRLPPNVAIHQLFGALSQSDQSRAIEPSKPGQRKIVLATSIAETSITIAGVRVVIDSGLQRLPIYEASTGITRLETNRVSQASADQRAGRAGRTEAGIAIRLWHEGQTAALPRFSPPQILSTDLSQFALDLAFWGVRDPSTLSLLDQPPKATLAEARTLLQQLGALDKDFAITQAGKAMRRIALPPRLAAMVMRASTEGNGLIAAQLSVLLTEQGLGGNDIDLDVRLRNFLNERSDRAEAAKGLARSILRALDKDVKVPASSPAPSAGELLIFAFPDRVAMQRGRRGRFIMANGRGAELEETAPLAGEEMLMVADLTGKAVSSRILSAARISWDVVEVELSHLIVSEDQVRFDAESGQIRARRRKGLGAITLEDTSLPRPTGQKSVEAVTDAIRMSGPSILRFSKEPALTRQRLGFLHRTIGAPWPDVSDEALQANVDTWFTPFQSSISKLQDISSSSLTEGLMSLVPFDQQREVSRLLPSHFEAPTGQRHPISYEEDEPVLTIRVQELYGLKNHPSVAGGRLPLLLKLTSPAHRPIQTTKDLPGFWAGSWKDVRADMRGRYPKHPWPEDPANALPTNRAKPRGT
jgi:ATP-dependent helicase HrpB